MDNYIAEFRIGNFQGKKEIVKKIAEINPEAGVKYYYGHKIG